MTIICFCSLPLCPWYSRFEIALKRSLPDQNIDQLPPAKKDTDLSFPSDRISSVGANARAALSVIRGEPYNEHERNKEIEKSKLKEIERSKEVGEGKDDEGNEDDRDDKDDEGDEGDDGDVGMADEAGQPPHPVNPFEVLVQNAIEEFGFAPRDVYEGVEDLLGTRKTHNAAVWSLDYLELRSLVDKFAYNQELDGISERVVVVRPFQTPEGVDDWEMDFKSVRIGEKVARLMRFVEKEELRQLYNEFRISSETSALSGWVFEAIIHRLFINGWRKPDGPVPQPLPMTSDRGKPPTFTYSPSASPPSLTTPRPVRIKHRDAILIDFRGKLDEITLEEHRYYMPFATNNPLFDSFTIDHKSGKPTIISFFQIMTSKIHGGAAEGYLLIRKIMGHVKTLLPQDDPNIKTKVVVVYFLVRPEGMRRGRDTWRMPVGWNVDASKDDHRGKVFCLHIPT